MAPIINLSLTRIAPHWTRLKKSGDLPCGSTFLSRALLLRRASDRDAVHGNAGIEEGGRVHAAEIMKACRAHADRAGASC